MVGWIHGRGIVNAEELHKVGAGISELICGFLTVQGSSQCPPHQLLALFKDQLRLFYEVSPGLKGMIYSNS